MREIWVYKSYTDKPVFILQNPSINLLRKFKMKGLFLIPKVGA